MLIWGRPKVSLKPDLANIGGRTHMSEDHKKRELVDGYAYGTQFKNKDEVLSKKLSRNFESAGLACASVQCTVISNLQY